MTKADPTIKFHGAKIKLSDAKNAIVSLQAAVKRVETSRGTRVLFEPYVKTMREVATLFGYSMDELLDTRSRGRLVDIRGALAYCFRESTLNGLQLSYPDIAAHVYGGTCHTTAFFAHDKVATRLEMGHQETTSDVRRITAIMLSYGIERKSR